MFFFSFSLKLICTCEFFKNMKLHSSERLVQIRHFEKLTRANCSNFNSKPYMMTCRNCTLWVLFLLFTLLVLLKCFSSFSCENELKRPCLNHIIWYCLDMNTIQDQDFIHTVLLEKVGIFTIVRQKNLLCKFYWNCENIYLFIFIYLFLFIYLNLYVINK